jgi:hypothetical protein
MFNEYALVELIAKKEREQVSVTTHTGALLTLTNRYIQ